MTQEFKYHFLVWTLPTYFGLWSRQTFVHWHRNSGFSLLFPRWQHPLAAHHYDYRRIALRLVDYLNYFPNQFVAKFSFEQLQLQLRIRFPIFEGNGWTEIIFDVSQEDCLEKKIVASVWAGLLLSALIWADQPYFWSVLVKETY